MRKALFFAVLLFLSLNAFAAECLTDVGCVGNEQCACITSFKIFDAERNEKTEFTAGETVYVDFTVKNAGTQKLENMKFFHIFSSGWAFANGKYSTHIASGVDLEQGESISYTNVAIQLKSYIPRDVDPLNYNLHIYVSTESNEYYHVPIRNVSIINPDPDWVGAVLSSGTRKSDGSTSWSTGTTISPSEEFDYKVNVSNKNNGYGFTVNVQILTQAIESCEVIPSGFSLGGNYSSCDVSLQPEESKEFVFRKCRLKPAYANGRQYFSTYVYYGSNLLRVYWPSVVTETPNIKYYNISADKDYLAKGETTTVTSRFLVDIADLPAGSKIVFSFTDNLYNVDVSSKEIVFTSGLEKGKYYNQSVEVNDYSGEALSNDFTVRAQVLYSDNTPVRSTWGSIIKRFSPPPPDEIVELDLYAAGQTYTETYNFPPNSQKQILLSENKNSAKNVTVSDVVRYAIQKSSEGTRVYVWPSSNPVKIAFSIAAVSAYDLSFFDGAVVLLLSVIFLLFFLRSNSFH